MPDDEAEAWTESSSGRMQRLDAEIDASLSWDPVYRDLCTTTDASAVEEQLANLSQVYQHWADLRAELKRGVGLAKMRREAVAARLMLAARATPWPHGKSRSVDDAKALVAIDPRLHDARTAELDAECKLDQITGTLEALSKQERALVQMSAYRRAELNLVR